VRRIKINQAKNPAKNHAKLVEMTFQGEKAPMKETDSSTIQYTIVRSMYYVRLWASIKDLNYHARTTSSVQCPCGILRCFCLP